MKRLIPVLLAAALASGCIVQSFHPFCAEKDKVAVAELWGEFDLVTAWGEDVSGKGIKPWVFREDDVLTYDQTNIAATIRMMFFKVGDTLLLNSYPASFEEGKASWYGFWHTTPVHTLCKVELQDDRALFVPLNLKWVLEQADTGKVTLPHVKHDEDKEMALFTATTAQWTEFLKKHAAKPEAFDEEHAYVLKKRTQKSSPSPPSAPPPPGSPPR